MSQHRTTAATAATAEQRTIALGFDLLEAALRDPSLLDNIPSGVTLVLLPADDPEVATRGVQLGLDALDRGEDVLFKHVRPAGRR